MISVGALVQGGIGPTMARLVVGPMHHTCLSFGMDTPRKVAAFVAQCAHESALFTATEENLRYSAMQIGKVWPRLSSRASSLAYEAEKLANAAYGGKNGNGDEASGDGWRYRGRGWIQLTGRANYRAYGYEDNPEVVATFPEAARSAGMYWKRNGCNEAMAEDDFDKTTRAINGRAMHGAEVRRKLFARFHRILTTTT